MDDDWFYMIRDEVRGPMTADQLRTAAIKGLVHPDTNVRKGANGDWVRATKVRNLLPSDMIGAGGAPAAPATPPKPSPVRIPRRETEPEASEFSEPPRPTVKRKRKPKVAPPELSQSPADDWSDEGEELPLLDTVGTSVSGPLKSRRSRHRSSPLPVLVVAVVGIGLLLGLLYFLSRS